MDFKRPSSRVRCGDRPTECDKCQHQDAVEKEGRNELEELERDIPLATSPGSFTSSMTCLREGFMLLRLVMLFLRLGSLLFMGEYWL